MNGIFTGEGDLSVLLIGNSLFLAIGQCLLPFFSKFLALVLPFPSLCLGGSPRGVLPIIAYTERLRPKGVPFSVFR